MGLKVMIVEDDQIVAADLRRKLLRMGHDVVATAASGEEAIRLAEDLRPQLVLMDIKLQGHMNGTQAAQRVQAVTAAPIFVTAYAGSFMAGAAQMQAANPCSSKPFSSYQLQVALNVMLDKRAY